jgi:hypothetical protein
MKKMLSIDLPSIDSNCLGNYQCVRAITVDEVYGGTFKMIERTGGIQKPLF